IRSRLSATPFCRATPCATWTPRHRRLSTWCSSTRHSTSTCCNRPANCWKARAGWPTTPGSTPKARPCHRASTCPATGDCTGKRRPATSTTRYGSATPDQADRHYYLLRPRMTATHPPTRPGTATDEAFTPAWWLPGGHLQTLWNPFFRRAAPLARRRERLWLADGDFIDLDWHGPHDPTAPLVLILHGLTGSSHSHYVLGLQAQLAAREQASVGST